MAFWWTPWRRNRLRRSCGSRLGTTSIRFAPRKCGFEPLEQRTLLAVFTVTTAADSGAGSLRQAILDANTSGGMDEIRFQIGSGAQTINLLTPLPAISETAVIDGTTQPGFTNSPLIELNGSAVVGGSGLVLSGGAITVRGLVINRFDDSGILVTSTGNTIVGNFIGTDLTGTVALGNGLYGVEVDNVASNVIGGTTAADRNVISGNGISGVYLNGPGAINNVVRGNYIGTNVLGTSALGNGFDGVEIFNGGGNFVGGTTAGAGNVISGNGGSGVSITGPAASFNQVQGNLIGTDAAGAEILSNELDGIIISDASSNTIGGAGAGARNVISGNGLSGVTVSGAGSLGNIIEGNFIGTASDGLQALGNLLDGITIVGAQTTRIGSTNPFQGNVIAFNGGAGVLVASGAGNSILSNSIYANTGLGIDLGILAPGAIPTADGITPNDPLDADAGANERQNFPLLTSALTGNGQTVIRGTLNSTPNSTFRIELFTNLPPDASGNGEGRGFLIAQAVNTDGAGNAAFTIVVPYETPRGLFVSATATNANNSTSEFSPNVALVGSRFLITAPGGPGEVIVRDQVTLGEHLRFFPYGPAFGGGVRVASADFTGDGIPDIVTAPGPGGGPHIRVFSGADGQQVPGPIGSFHAYDPAFTGGVYIAVGDVDGDTVPDIITGADTGGGPHVQVFNGSTGALLASFFAYNPAFTGGVRVAAADLTGDSRADIITAAGPGGGPHVLAFDATTVGATPTPFLSFFAYGEGFGGGVYVSAGDVDGNSQVDIVTGAGAGGGPHVRSFDGMTGAQLGGPIGSFFAYDPAFGGGVRVATANSNEDGAADIVTAPGPGGGPHINSFRGPDAVLLQSFFAYPNNFTSGVFVAGSALPPLVGSPLLLAAGLDTEACGQLLDENLLGWFAQSLSQDVSRLPVEIADLPPGYLALAQDGVILLDRDGAGQGWFVDATPRESEEFGQTGPQGLLATDAAAKGVDLLTVLAHELGHLQGLADLDADDHAGHLMSGRLAAGVRREDALAALDAYFSANGN